MIAPHMIQGSPEWLAYRATRGGASEAAAVLGIGAYMPRNMRELWEVKKGRREVYVNAAMRRGQALEESARLHVERVEGLALSPDVVEEGRLISSLDGVTFDRKVVAEIKIPARGRESDLAVYVDTHGKPPPHYMAQCQQQMMICNPDEFIFAVCFGENEIDDSIRVPVEPDPEMQARIRAAWDMFFAYLDSDEPPPTGDDERDDDAEYVAAAQAWREAKAALTVASEAEAEARKALIALCDADATVGGGVKVKRYWTSRTNYKAAAESAGVDLSEYQGEGSYSWRLTVEDGK